MLLLKIKANLGYKKIFIFARLAKKRNQTHFPRKIPISKEYKTILLTLLRITGY